MRKSRRTVGGLVTMIMLASTAVIAHEPAWGASCTINGSSGSNTIQGTSGNDVICGHGGNDVIYGHGGNDIIYGGTGDDTIYAGSGNDWAAGEDGTDRVFGESGTDTIYGGTGNDLVYGGSGNDTVKGESGNDTVRGESGNDKVYGDSGTDKVYGDGEDDSVYGGGGNDLLYGGPGNDYLSGETESDTCTGESGTDSVNDFTCEKRSSAEHLRPYYNSKDLSCGLDDVSCLAFSGYTGQSVAGYPVCRKHNCTNYAAYRLAKRGLTSSQIPKGNAYQWNNQPGVLTVVANTSPGVGDVAQWESYGSSANDCGGINCGHVAYVERVARNSSGAVTSITISESSWCSGGKVRTITAGTSGWPSRFLRR
jgi:surface antigen